MESPEFSPYRKKGETASRAPERDPKLVSRFNRSSEKQRITVELGPLFGRSAPRDFKLPRNPTVIDVTFIIMYIN
jgi:hypothetical protein